MAFIVAFICFMAAAIFSNVWIALGGALAAIFLLSAQQNWLHHHMHDDHNHEEDL